MRIRAHPTCRGARKPRRLSRREASSCSSENETSPSRSTQRRECWVSLVTLTPHEEEDCFSVTSILRNLPQLPEFVVAWDYPLMRLAKDLNPEALRRPQSKSKVCSDKEFVEAVLGDKPRNFTSIVKDAETTLPMSRRTAMNYLKRLTEAGMIVQSSGLYWRKDSEEGQEGNIP